jgi:choline dehydrogenase-like flavoprotein
VSSDDRLAVGLSVLWEEVLASDGGEPMFDIVVVGSGYGGSTAAAYLAGSRVPLADGGSRPARVCLLERGREYLPGEFPSRFGDLPKHVRIADQNSGRVRSNHEGLFDLRLGDDVAALVANGLGGGSLINAGVLLRPRPDDFEPGAWRDRISSRAFRRKSSFMMFLLGALTRQGHKNDIALHPDGKPAKTEALRTLAGKNLPCETMPITVSMLGEANSAHVRLPVCTQCGDCMTGCNVGAKDSLDVNLLRIAARRGESRTFEVYTGASVLSLRRGPNRNDNEVRDGLGMSPAEPHWVLSVAHTDPRLQSRETGPLPLRARKVVLAAGALGSPEILLRSRTDRLMFSPRLGEGFSCNGDNIAAVHRMKDVVNGCAEETQPLTPGRKVGPTITAAITMPGGHHRPFLIQEFAVPAPLKRLFDEAVTTARVLAELDQDDPVAHGAEDAQAIDPAAVDHDAMKKTLLVGVIGHDAAQGHLHLPQINRPIDRPAQQGVVRIHWPDARHACELNASHAAFEALVADVARRTLDSEPSVIANPMWRLLPESLERLVSQPRGPVLTVHPLGGCRMGANGAEGVVDASGRVYDMGADTDDAWFGSLAVLDGSIVPGSLGVNPALTIATLAADGARALRRSWGWGVAAQATDKPDELPRPLAPPPPHPVPGVRPGSTKIQVIERLSGPVPLRIGPKTELFHAEITLAYQPVAIADLTSTLRREIHTDGSTTNRLRLYPESAWREHELRVKSDPARAEYLAFEAALSGTLYFLHREDSAACQRRRRSIWAWLRNRGLRDIWQELRDPKPPEHPRPTCPGGAAESFSLRKRWREFKALASHAGEVRRFDYTLTVGASVPGTKQHLVAPGTTIRGFKRLTYNLRANPWRQLMQLSLDEFPGMPDSVRPVLELDPRFLANQRIPLLRIAEQADQANALADLGSFALYMARVLVSVHLWTFRKPDRSDLPEPQRLPGEIKGLPAPRITELEVDRPMSGGPPVKVRLTHYPRLDATGLPPLVMIHGYSVSGNTFTHPSLAPSAAEWFWRGDSSRGRPGRDIWVVDLRTSTGMPTATQPWAMEQPALIDIPAALLHVRNVTGRRVDVFAHCIGCVMLSMALLTDARRVRADQQQLGVYTWLTSEHLGLLSAFNGSQPQGGPHPCIERVVLSQKGPVLRYSDGNLLRAYILQYMRRWLMSGTYDFRPPRQPTVSDELLDRILSSLPYPDADYDVENPIWPCARTPWVATRHRMDALYGRDFNADNMSPASLKAIDDLFGPMHLDTVAQTIHFARFNAITNQRGRGEFVTFGQLRDRWSGMPTLAVHGQDNGLVDVTTQTLLDDHLREAGVPFERQVFEHMGHQDCLIGLNATRVFERVATFLAKPMPAAAASAKGEKTCTVVELPWIGPRIDVPESAGVPLRVASLSRPDQGKATHVLWPALLIDGKIELQQWPNCVVKAPHARSSRDWTWVDLPSFALRAMQCHAGQRLQQAGWLLLHFYDRDETTANTIEWQSRVDPEILTKAWPVASPQSFFASMGFSDGCSSRMQTEPPLGNAFVSYDDALHAMQAVHEPEPRVLTLALGSCQYPAGLLDRPISEASLQRLALSIQGIDLVLFVGDQIYADATAGLADPVRRDELFDQPHERALRAEPMRQIMRQRSVRTLPDDHEISDNWEPMSPAASKARPEDDKKNKRLRKNGFAAWRRHQPNRHLIGNGADQTFRFAGHPFFMLDTRTQRSPRGTSVAGQNAQLINETQRRALATWLLAHRDSVKFVASPSLLLPPRRATARELAQPNRRGEHLVNDGWDGYPATTSWLLAFLAAHHIGRTVFLSGDEHHALWCEAHLQPPNGGAATQVVSIHGSALYAPLPFANGLPQDLMDCGGVTIGTVQVTMDVGFAPPGDGYVRVGLDPATLDVTIAFDRAVNAPPVKTIRLR